MVIRATTTTQLVVQQLLDLIHLLHLHTVNVLVGISRVVLYRNYLLQLQQLTLRQPRLSHQLSVNKMNN